MDAKILVGGVVGLGLLGIAGILILGAGSDSSGVQRTSGSTSAIDIDPRVSAYEIAEADPEELPDIDIDIQPKDLQPARRDGRGERGRGGRDGFARMEQMIEQFDADGDGMLDETEREAMAQAMRQRMIDRFDADGDGMVSIEEQFAARRAFLTDPEMAGRRGNRLINEFDADGDGVLSDTETALMNADLDARDAKRLEEIVAQYDTDGDGVMSTEETLAMQDQQFNDRRSRMDEFAIQFDADGDGNLNADERVDAQTTMIEQRQLDGFLRRYDTNGDRQVGTSDYERFSDAYGKKEPYGDVNRDGIYNMDDIVMFRDMTERANAVDN